MKPKPPALETSTASEGPDSTRIGAPTMNGAEVHGNAVFNRAMTCRCIVKRKMRTGEVEKHCCQEVQAEIAFSLKSSSFLWPLSPSDNPSPSVIGDQTLMISTSPRLFSSARVSLNVLWMISTTFRGPQYRPLGLSKNERPGLDREGSSVDVLGIRLPLRSSD